MTDRQSGATQVEILIFVERPSLLKLTFSEVFSLLDPRWITEKLLYFRIALGRRIAVDYIFDVERESIIYREAFEDGEILRQQARESCAGSLQHEEICNPACFRLHPDG